MFDVIILSFSSSGWVRNICMNGEWIFIVLILYPFLHMLTQGYHQQEITLFPCFIASLLSIIDALNDIARKQSKRKQ